MNALKKTPQKPINKPGFADLKVIAFLHGLNQIFQPSMSCEKLNGEIK